jgi:DNA-binding CsgD family transcriptional regulator
MKVTHYIVPDFAIIVREHELAEEYAAGVSLTALAAKYNYSHGTIKKHLQNAGVTVRRRGSSKATEPRFKRRVLAMMEARRAGKTYREIAELFNCRHQNVAQLLSRWDERRAGAA